MAKGPLAIFRRNQKILLVVFGLAIMLVFVLGDSVMRFLGGGPRTEADRNPVVVEWAGEVITERDLARRRTRHNLILRFLDDCLRIFGCNFHSNGRKSLNKNIKTETTA